MDDDGFLVGFIGPGVRDSASRCRPRGGSGRSIPVCGGVIRPGDRRRGMQPRNIHEHLDSVCVVFRSTMPEPTTLAGSCVRCRTGPGIDHQDHRCRSLACSGCVGRHQRLGRRGFRPSRPVDHDFACPVRRRSSGTMACRVCLLQRDRSVERVYRRSVSVQFELQRQLGELPAAFRPVLRTRRAPVCLR